MGQTLFEALGVFADSLESRKLSPYRGTRWSPHLGQVRRALGLEPAVLGPQNLVLVPQCLGPLAFLNGSSCSGVGAGWVPGSRWQPAAGTVETVRPAAVCVYRPGSGNLLGGSSCCFPK